MNSKFYVSLEAARLLKKKGYDIRGDYVYAPDSRIIPLAILSNWSDDYFSAPTKAEAIDWLESKGIIVELSVTHDLCHWVFSIYMKDGGILDYVDFDFDSFTTRLEAEEAAIIKALELL